MSRARIESAVDCSGASDRKRGLTLIVRRLALVVGGRGASSFLWIDSASSLKLAVLPLILLLRLGWGCCW